MTFINYLIRVFAPSRFRDWLWLVVVVATAARGMADEPQAIWLDGPTTSDRLVRCDARWQLTFAGESRARPAADLVRYGHFAELSKGPLVVLADGGLLVADVLGADKENLSIDGDACGECKVPLEALAGVVYRLPPARRERDALIDRLLKLKADQDVAILDNGDQLTGMVESLTEKTLVFRAAVGEVKIEVSRLMALALNPSLRKAAKEDGLRAWVGLTDGGRLLAGSLTLKDDELTATTLAGRLTTPARYLAAVQPLGGKAVYLSDLTPADYRHVPFLDLTWPWRADRAVTGAWPRAGGRLWLKGLGVHSTAKLSYALRDEYQRFEAFCAIDDSTAGGGSVRFRVYVDGREVFTSPIIRGRDKPVPVSVDVTGGKMLDLVVDFADRGDTLDHALWLEARITK